MQRAHYQLTRSLCYETCKRSRWYPVEGGMGYLSGASLYLPTVSAPVYGNPRGGAGTKRGRMLERTWPASSGAGG